MKMKRRTVVVLLVVALAAVWISRGNGDGFAAKARSVLAEMSGVGNVQTELQADYAYMIDAKNGNALYAKNERRRAYPASTTKILTTLLALELGKPDDKVKIGSEANPEDPEESRAGLRPGQTMKLYDLVEAALLPSGNDAARSLAVHIARQVDKRPDLDGATAQRRFAELMNKRAKKAGATDSHFTNPSGLHDPDHYSTARDMALIAKAAMANPLFRSAVKATDYAASAINSSGASAAMALANTNQLLQPGSPYYFPGATGIKTGFTDQAGYCLVSSAESGGREVIAVVLHSTSQDVYPDALKLLRLGF